MAISNSKLLVYQAGEITFLVAMVCCRHSEVVSMFRHMLRALHAYSKRQLQYHPIEHTEAMLDI